MTFCKVFTAMEKLLQSDRHMDDSRTNALLHIFDEWVHGKVEAVAVELQAVHEE